MKAIIVILILVLAFWVIRREFRKYIARREREIRKRNPRKLRTCRYCKYNYIHPATKRVDCLRHRLKEVGPNGSCGKFLYRTDDIVHYTNKNIR